MFFDKMTEVLNNPVIFTVEKLGKKGNALSSYKFQARQGTTLERAWETQKIWFRPGTQVRITDENGNKHIFIKE